MYETGSMKPTISLRTILINVFQPDQVYIAKSHHPPLIFKFLF